MSLIFHRCFTKLFPTTRKLFFFFFNMTWAVWRAPPSQWELGSALIHLPNSFSPIMEILFTYQSGYFLLHLHKAWVTVKKSLWEYARLQNRFPFPPNGRFKILKLQWFCKLNSMVFEALYFFLVNVTCIFYYKNLTKIVI